MGRDGPGRASTRLNAGLQQIEVRNAHELRRIQLTWRNWMWGRP
jgi:hypothetical protein